MQLAWQFTFCQHAAKIFPESSGATAEKNSNAFASASCSFGADCCSDLVIIVHCPWLIQASDEMPSDILKMEVRKSILKYSYRAKALWAAASTNYYWQKKNWTCLEPERSFQKSAKTPESVQAHLQPYYIMWTGAFQKMIISYQIDNFACLLERNIRHLTSVCNVTKLLAI